MEQITIGAATLYHGDCANILPTLPQVDAVVTDPPYGIGEAAGRAKTRQNAAKARDYGNDAWDDKPISAELLAAVRDAGRWQIIFGGNFYDCPATSCWLIWDKCNSGDFADCEMAWTNLPKAVRLKRYLWNGMIREPGAARGDHPTQKPLEIMKWCIGHLPNSDTILDPFAGSGTTGVAAIQLGKAFVGIERERKYFDAMCRRIAEASGEDIGPLFDAGCNALDNAESRAAK